MVRDSQAASPERIEEIDEAIDRITHWTKNREAVVGLLLVGSCARNAARPDSDVDLVLLTTDESRYLNSDTWATELGLGPLIVPSRGERSQSDAIPRPPA
ncbi:nucleotidyltransferase domain-containing protein [Streptomyces sp. NPDC004009]